MNQIHNREKKQAELDALYNPYKNCKACPLGSLGRTNVVFGEGNPNSNILFIGEGPGQKEDELARPFVGRSGKLLNAIFSMFGVQRDDVYISNIVKCRPPQNRKPLPIEVKTCTQLLLYKQIEIIQPYVICTLGATATEEFLNKPIRMSEIRGKILPFQDYVVIPTYHPAYTLRNPHSLPILKKDLQLVLSQAKESR